MHIVIYRFIIFIVFQYFPGNNILDNAINMVFMNVPQDLWVKAETEVSSLSVKIRQEKVRFNVFVQT